MSKTAAEYVAEYERLANESRKLLRKIAADAKRAKESLLRDNAKPGAQYDEKRHAMVEELHRLKRGAQRTVASYAKMARQWRHAAKLGNDGRPRRRR